MTVGDKIKTLRKSIGLTQTELGERVGVKKNAVSKWECGRVEDIPTSTIKLLATLFNVPASYLIDDEPDEKYSTESGIFDSSFVPYNPTHRIPILGKISAGLPLYAEEHIEGYTYTELNGGAEYFALIVNGDSMNAARIYDGDTLIVRRQDSVENGEIAVVIVNDDEATVKRFFIDGANITLMPQSTNPIHHPQIYDARYTNIRIVGRVVKNEITF